MRKIIPVVILLVLGYFAWNHLGSNGNADRYSHSSDQLLADAFRDGRGGLQVEGTGEVIRILPDDNDGGRHQRFVVELDSGQTLMIAHNIDLAPRVAALKEGDEIVFFGEYEWNSKGGVIHWTHHDPQGRHAGGWLEHKGRTYR